MIEQVISGGQTGVDQVALAVAQSLGFKTGGTVPKGWRTDDGPAPWLGTQYGCVEDFSSQYEPRTARNVRDAQMTLWFGDIGSPGGQLTRKLALIEQNRQAPHYRWLFVTGKESPGTLTEIPEILSSIFFGCSEWLKVLNVAGNRLRYHPEATELAREILTKALRP